MLARHALYELGYISNIFYINLFCACDWRSGTTSSTIWILWVELGCQACQQVVLPDQPPPGPVCVCVCVKKFKLGEVGAYLGPRR